MSHVGKMIAAFLTPLLGTPFLEWIDGSKVFDAETITQAVVIGLGAAVTVYFTPNKAKVTQ